MSLTQNKPGSIYEIQVWGELNHNWESYFNEMTITLAHTKKPPIITTMVGPVEDQAALRGLLCKLWDLNLTLVSVSRIEADVRKEGDNV